MEDSFLKGQAKGAKDARGLPISLDYSICIQMSFFISHLCVLFVTFACIVAANPKSNPSFDTYIAHTCTHNVCVCVRKGERERETFGYATPLTIHVHVHVGMYIWVHWANGNPASCQRI